MRAEQIRLIRFIREIRVLTLNLDVRMPGSLRPALYTKNRAATGTSEG